MITLRTYLLHAVANPVLLALSPVTGAIVGWVICQWIGGAW